MKTISKCEDNCFSFTKAFSEILQPRFYASYFAKKF